MIDLSGWNEFLLAITVVLTINSLFFIFCQFVKDNSWIDTLWGLSFIFPNLAIVIKRSQEGAKEVDMRTFGTLALVSIWAVRLALHIGLR